ATIDLWQTLKFVPDGFLSCREIAADLRYHLLDYATILGQQGREEMFNFNLAVILLSGKLSRAIDGLAGFVGKMLNVHAFFAPAPNPNGRHQDAQANAE